RDPLPADGLGRTSAQAAKDSGFRVAGTDEPYPEDRLPGSRAMQGETTSRDDIEAVLSDRRVPLEVWATPVFDAGGRVQYAIVAFQDITQRRQAEEELRHFRQQLESLVLTRTAALSAANTRLNREMAERNALEQSIQLRAEWLAAYSKISQSVVRAEDLPRALNGVAQVLPRFTGATAAGIFLDEGESGELRLAATSSGGPEGGGQLSDAHVGDVDRWSRLVAGEVIVLDARADVSPWRGLVRTATIQTVILAPIIVGGAFAGALALAAESAIPEENVSPPATVEIAADVAQLIEKARLMKEAEHLLAEEARSGLARDLHDSVTQVLFSASLVADILPQVWRRNPEEAERGLNEVRRLNRAALAEMRSLLLELRPAAILSTPLSELMSQLVEAATSRSELDFELYLEPMPPLPDEVHIGFYRIAQEAMNNVVKHSGATRVRLTLRAQPPFERHAGTPWTGRVLLFVDDDGKGTSPQAPELQGRGLAIMHERAESLQADLLIRSVAGQGTTVRLRWPAGGANDE
ncbi:MAG TPA: histidine kinase, partial [Anaerolineales bacterium]|nr:histidine kinase [Anaerolineales bacterium]